MVIGISENYTIDLIDIADELLIVNKKTIDTLMELDNSADCIALYVFYYKTAKWQKTNQIKATDTYAMKCLGWGKQKLMRTKETLRTNGLIDIVQTRDGEGKIKGWYIRLHYLVTQRELSDCKVVIQKYQNPQVDESTSGEQNTNALRQNNKCLKTEEEVLKGEFATLWELYPNKKGKQDALKCYIKARKDGVTYEQVEAGIKAYAEYVRVKQTSKEYMKHGSTFFRQKSWEDDWSTGTSSVPSKPSVSEEEIEWRSITFDEMQRMEYAKWEKQQELEYEKWQRQQQGN